MTILICGQFPLHENVFEDNLYIVSNLKFSADLIVQIISYKYNLKQLLCLVLKQRSISTIVGIVLLEVFAFTQIYCASLYTYKQSIAELNLEAQYFPSSCSFYEIL